MRQYINRYNIFLEKLIWTELSKGDDTIRVVIPKNANYVVKLTKSFDAANTAQLVSKHTNNPFIANIYQVNKIKGTELYFIVEELIDPLSDSEIEKLMKTIVKIAINSTTIKIPLAFEKAKQGLLDFLYWLYEHNVAIEHELAYSYYPIFQYINKSLKIKEFDLNSHNMGKRKDKYILFDLTASVKKQDIKEIIAPQIADQDSLIEWYIKTQIKKLK